MEDRLNNRDMLYVAGTRADYGLMRRTLRNVDCHAKLSLSLLVTGMHLSDELGSSIDDLAENGFDTSQRNVSDEFRPLIVSTAHPTSSWRPHE